MSHFSAAAVKSKESIPAALTPKVLEPFQLSPSQYQVLLQLNEYPQLSSSNLIPIAQSLEVRGLIHFRQYKSGLFWFLGIAGQAMLAAIATILEAKDTG